MIASAPRRSASACQSSSASPTRRAAASASRSSHEPGNWTTPNFTLDLVVLDQRVRQQPLAHLADPRGVFDVELHQPPDVHVAHALEAQRGQGALDGLALRVEDPGLGPDQDPHPQGAVRSSHAENGSPASRSYAVT